MNTPPLKVSPFRASAGYDYNLTVIASTYKGNEKNNSIGYNSFALRSLNFLDKGNPACSKKIDYNKNIKLMMERV